MMMMGHALSEAAVRTPSLVRNSFASDFGSPLNKQRFECLCLSYVAVSWFGRCVLPVLMRTDLHSFDLRWTF